MNLQELTSLVNEMTWSYSQNGRANESKLDLGATRLNNSKFTEEEVQNAIDNHGFVDLSQGNTVIAKTIAANLGADKLRNDNVYYEMYDENASFELN